MSDKIRTIFWLLVLVLGLPAAAGCGGKTAEEKTSEEAAEKIIKQTSGQDVDVKIAGGKINLEGKDSSTEMAETAEWPADMFADVPQFTFGKIQRVIKAQEATGMKKFNIFLVDLEADGIDRYATMLKENGWQTNLMQMGGKGGMLNAQKNNLAMNFPYDLQKNSGALMVYSVPK